MEYYNKFRPKEIEDIVGQTPITSLLKHWKVNSKKIPHTILLSGPSGTGKTSIAYIIRELLGSTYKIEINGAVQTGVDDMRELQSNLCHKGFLSQSKVCIIDECHKISGSGWNSLLKIMENPPEHVYFIFCTTDAAKLSNPVKSRCHVITFKPLSSRSMLYLVDRVLSSENFTLDRKISDKLVDTCNGNARYLLSKMYLLRNINSTPEALELLDSNIEEVEAVELCRLLLKKAYNEEYFIRLGQKLNRLRSSMSAENLRLLVINYIGSVAFNKIDNNNASAFIRSRSQLEDLITILRVFYNKGKILPSGKTGYNILLILIYKLIEIRKELFHDVLE